MRDKEDQRYRLLRSVFRNRLAIWAFRWLHPDVGAWVAADWSDTSRTYQARDGGAGLRQVAEEQLKATGSPELLIFGHSHVAALERAGTGVYANAGAWLHKPTFLRLTSERIELCSWNGTGGDVVRTVNRER